MVRYNLLGILTFLFTTVLISGCNLQKGFKARTAISVKGDLWYLNDTIINKGSPAEGLLMNVRMVNSVFEDRGDKLPAEFKDFDPEKNTDEFISRIPDYVASGVNCFTISLQGGMPGYEGAVNTAFEPDGSLRDEYMSRVARVIRSADVHSAAIILSCFYQRQHSNPSALEGREAINKAVSATSRWIKKNRFSNVILEISNEYRHGGYRNWKDGRWLVSTKGQIDLINVARENYPGLLVSTSGMGDGQLNDSLVAAADYVSLHFNNTALEDYSARIARIKRYGKPVLCNEDDKTGPAGAGAALFSVMNGCGWGYMNSRQNQTIPFRFDGVNDDTVTYNMMKKVVTPGYPLDRSVLTRPFVIITYPNDGDIFKAGQAVTIRFSYVPPDTTGNYILRILANSREAGTPGTGKNQFRLELKEPGIIYLSLEVTDDKNNTVLRSPKVDIIVQE